MKEIFKTKAGIILASIYIILIWATRLEDVGSKPEAMDRLAFLILTLPWSFLLLVFFGAMGIVTAEKTI